MLTQKQKLENHKLKTDIKKAQFEIEEKLLNLKDDRTILATLLSGSAILLVTLIRFNFEEVYLFLNSTFGLFLLWSLIYQTIKRKFKIEQLSKKYGKLESKKGKKMSLSTIVLSVILSLILFIGFYWNDISELIEELNN